jgi:hypothetical protein
MDTHRGVVGTSIIIMVCARNRVVVATNAGRSEGVRADEIPLRFVLVGTRVRAYWSARRLRGRRGHDGGSTEDCSQNEQAHEERVGGQPGAAECAAASFISCVRLILIGPWTG